MSASAAGWRPRSRKGWPCGRACRCRRECERGGLRQAELDGTRLSRGSAGGSLRGRPEGGPHVTSEHPPTATPNCMPSLAELGHDLLHVTPRQRWTALALPFACFAAYFLLAAWGWWVPAVLAVVAFSFFTYGSTSHDLVHRSLGLPRAANDALLCVIELLALRSGHAYRAAHLNHHARFPSPDDVEARAAGKSLLRALAEGPLYVARLWLWAVCNASQGRAWIIAEG